MWLEGNGWKIKTVTPQSMEASHTEKKMKLHVKQKYTSHVVHDGSHSVLVLSINQFLVRKA